MDVFTWFNLQGEMLCQERKEKRAFVQTSIRLSKFKSNYLLWIYKDYVYECMASGHLHQ